MRRIPGTHAPNVKNRSSKNLSCFTKMRPIVRCINTEQLNRWANANVTGAAKELSRRRAKADKKAN